MQMTLDDVIRAIEVGNKKAVADLFSEMIVHVRNVEARLTRVSQERDNLVALVRRIQPMIDKLRMEHTRLRAKYGDGPGRS